MRLNDEHRLKATLPIDLIDVGIWISESDEHPLNDDSLIDVTDDGMLIFKSDEHPRNASLPIDVTVSGIETDFNDEQPSKTWSSIAVICDEIVISINFLHCSKHCGPISIPGCESKRLMISIWLFSPARCKAVTWKKLNDNSIQKVVFF